MQLAPEVTGAGPSEIRGQDHLSRCRFGSGRGPGETSGYVRVQLGSVVVPDEAMMRLPASTASRERRTSLVDLWPFLEAGVYRLALGEGWGLLIY